VVAVLLVMVVLLVFGVIGTGLGAPAKQASAGARLGAAFVGQVGTADSLALVIAAVVLAWAAHAGAARRAVVVLRWAVLLSAVALLVAAPFAVWGDVAYLHRTHQAVDLVTRRQLATYLAVTMIPDGLAAVLAWWVRAPQGGPAWFPTTTLP
jgi:glucan phosphoethanolaminetransferase (alkaline phosphatase superfamily)